MYLAWTRDLGLQGRRLFSAAAIAVCLVAFLARLVPEDRGRIAPASPEVPTGRLGSLAVLPLDDLSAEPGQEYFAAGMTEILIAELSRFGAFKVISRTSVMRYAGTTKTLPEIADELGVDAIVEGSVLRAGNFVRITAQLIEAATDHHLWADSFESEIQDVLALQKDAAHAIARGIGAKIDAVMGSRQAARTVNAETLDAYLRSRMLYLEAPSHPEDAIAAIERVIELDPEFAPGYALLSDVYGYLALINNVTHGDACLRARQLAARALQLDPRLAYAHIAMGRVLFQFEWDWDAAEEELERGLALDPNNSDGLVLYGAFRVLVHKDCETGIAILEAAVERDPFNPAMHFDLGVYNFQCRRPEAAIPALDRTSELAPNFLHARMIRAWSFSMLQKHDEAAQQCEAVESDFGKTFDTMLYVGCSCVYQRGGRADAAQGLVARLMNPPQDAYVDPMMLAFACAGIDEHDCALENLERSLRERSSNLIYLRTAPALDAIRTHPRFRRVFDAMLFPEGQTVAGSLWHGK